MIKDATKNTLCHIPLKLGAMSHNSYILVNGSLASTKQSFNTTTLRRVSKFSPSRWTCQDASSPPSWWTALYFHPAAVAEERERGRDEAHIFVFIVGLGNKHVHGLKTM
jgi:hypothetical protein